MNPRKPTKEEKKELFDYLISEGWGMGTVPEEVVEKDLNAWINEAAIAVFDQFTIDSESLVYRGKVIVVVWLYERGIKTETFVWRGGKLELVPNIV